MPLFRNILCHFCSFVRLFCASISNVLGFVCVFGFKRRLNINFAYALWCQSFVYYIHVYCKSDYVIKSCWFFFSLADSSVSQEEARVFRVRVFHSTLSLASSPNLQRWIIGKHAKASLCARPSDSNDAQAKLARNTWVWADVRNITMMLAAMAEWKEGNIHSHFCLFRHECRRPSYA